MKKILIVLILPLLVILSNCKKENENKTYTVTGKIFNSCNNPVPIIGKEFVLEYNYNTGSSKGGEDLGSCVTDNEGRFSITYKRIDKKDVEMNLSVKNTFGYNSILGDIPQNIDIDAKEIYLNPAVLLIYKIKPSQKITTNQDTIYYDIGKTNKMIVGPFENMQVIDTITRYPSQCYCWSETDSKIVRTSFSWKTQRNSSKIVQVSVEYNVCDNQTEAIIDLSKAK